MRASVGILVCILGVVAARTDLENVADYTFSEYVTDFGKTYDNDAEKMLHELQFNQNLLKVTTHNADPTAPYKMAVNQFTDMSPLEFKRFKGYSISQATSRRLEMPMAELPSINLKDLPTSVDWRTKNIITPAKNQGACGSCWAFAATEEIESVVAQNTGKLLQLSPQNVVSCTPNPQQCGGTGGCAGATAELAFGYVSDKGIASNADYPYRGITGTCDETIKKSAKISSFVKLPENNYTALMIAVATIGPIAVSVDASSWGGYGSGIFTGCPKPGQFVDIDHAVQLVGYGTDSRTKKDYWLVRNSWGGGWGEGGYIRIERHSDGTTKWCNTDKTPGDGSGCQGGPAQVTVCGSCGIWYDTCYPTGGSIVE
jgi:cathepsin L